MADNVNTRIDGRMGNFRVLSGTLEASNGTAVYITGSSSSDNGTPSDRAGSRIISCLLNNVDAADEAFKVLINSNDGVADSLMGAIYVTAEASGAQTYNYQAVLDL
jgi:hypothetical protein